MTSRSEYKKAIFCNLDPHHSLIPSQTVVEARNLALFLSPQLFDSSARTVMNQVVVVTACLCLLFTLTIAQVTLQGKWRPSGKRSSLPQLPGDTPPLSGENSVFFLLEVPDKDIDVSNGFNYRNQLSDQVSNMAMNNSLNFVNLRTLTLLRTVQEWFGKS